MCATFDIFLLLCINCLGMCLLDLLELLISAEKTVPILTLKVFDG